VAWLQFGAGGSRVVGSALAPRLVFKVPEGNYLVGTTDSKTPMSVAVLADATKSITIKRRRP
jgi:hypothetical protein